MAVETAPIQLDVQGAAATLRAGDVLDLKTRALNHHDHLCGNEEVYYPPLTDVADAVPAVNDLRPGWVTALDLPLIPGVGTIR